MSDQPVSMSPGTSLVRSIDEAQLSVAQARGALEEIVDLDIVRDIANRAAGMSEYLKRARETRHLAVRATEVRLWAERRAGELLAAQGVPVDACGEYARSVGLSSQTIRRWLRLALAEESAMTKVIADYGKDDRRELTVTGVERRLLTRSVKRVERGIYLNALGTYVIRFRRQGVSHQVTLDPADDLMEARRELLSVTKRIRPEPAPREARREPIRDVMDAYSYVRRILQDLDSAAPLLKTEVRQNVEDARSALYKAEDALGAALRASQ